MDPDDEATGRSEVEGGGRPALAAPGRPDENVEKQTPVPLGGGVVGRRAGRLAPVLISLLAGAVAVVGAGLAAGVLRIGSASATGGVRVVDEVAVTAMNQIVGFSNNSPVIVADPNEARFIAMANRLDAPDFGCALQVSGDGGRTWATTKPVARLPEGADKCYAPEIAFDADGVLYYLFVGLAGNGNEPMGAFLTTSSDRGRTFATPQRVLGPANFGVRMAIDPELGRRGRIHLLWLRATSETPLGGFGPPPNPILSAYSDNGGRTFSKPVQISDPGRARVVAPALALGPDHAVYAAYYDLRRDAVDYQGLEGPAWEEPWSLVVSSSFDGGRRFGPGRVVDEEIIAAERVMLIFTMPPSALVAGRGGQVCLAWTDARHGDADALSRCSTDRGRTWKALRRLNDDRVGSGTRQYLPRLSLSPDGRLDAVFFDRRDDPRNVSNHVYFTYSTDGGRTFAANRKVSGEPSDTRIGAQYANASAEGQYEIGARLGLLSERSRAVAAWPDTRHSERDTTGQDLFSANIATPEVHRVSSAARLTGAGLLAAGLGALAVVTIGRRAQRRAGSAAP